MVLTNYECWANTGGDNNIIDITVQQTQLRSQIDLFNPRILSACGIANKDKCAQPSGSCEMFPKKVSQISSNGYYGFMYVNNNNNDDVAGNGNDVNTSFGNYEHHVFDSNLVTNRNKTNAFDSTTVSQRKKRALVDGEFTSTLNAKRCRQETDQEILNCLPLTTSNMDVDDIEFHNPISSSPMSQPHKHFNVKSPEKISNQDSTQINAKFNIIECNKNCIENRIYIQELEGEAKGYEKNRISENGEMFLEEMFSETHGSGVYHLQNME